MNNPDLTLQDAPRLKHVQATAPAINYGRDGSGAVGGGGGRKTKNPGGIAFTRMQCLTCRTVLACEYGRRRKRMLCPVCRQVALLAYLPPSGDRELTPLTELPVARRPGLMRSRLLVPGVFFALGMLAGVLVYALDYGQTLDRITRGVIQAVQEELIAPALKSIDSDKSKP